MTRQEMLDMILLGMRSARLIATLKTMGVPIETLESSLLTEHGEEIAAVLLEAINIYLEEDTHSPLFPPERPEQS